DSNASAYEEMADGTTFVARFAYDVVDEWGARVAQTATLTITGTNDAPVVSGAVTGDVTEDGASSTLDALLHASDVDAGTTLQVVDVPGSLPAGVTYDAATRSFTLDPSDPAYQSLADGQTTTVTVAYGVSDGIATVPASVSWTVTGTNDAPVVTAAVTGGADEGSAKATVDLLQHASDVDAGAVLQVENLVWNEGPNGMPAGFVLVGDTIEVDTDFLAYDGLALGETFTATFTYDVVDEHGARITQHASITITGTNDAPVVSSAVTQGADEGSGTATVDLLQHASDADSGAVLQVENLVWDEDPDGMPPGFVWVGDTVEVDTDSAAYDGLAQGETFTATFTYDVVDEHGARVTQHATITITGTNDAPVVSAAVTGGADEGSGTATVDLLQHASDVDSGAVLHVENLVWDEDPDGMPPGFVRVGDTVEVDTDSPAYDSLGQGETLTATFTYDVVDEHGTRVIQHASITITGTNDAPVVSGAVTGTATEDGALVSLNALATASDVDVGTTLEVVNVPAAGDLPAGVIYDPVLKSFTLDPSHSSYQSLAQGQTTIVTVAYGVSDGIATTPASVTWTVTGTNDAPHLISSPTAALRPVEKNTGLPQGAVGTLVSELVGFTSAQTGPKNVADPDQGALLGIALTGVNSAHGTWWYSRDGGSHWEPVNPLAGSPVSDHSALLLESSARLYFQPATGYNGTVAEAITFRAWDRTSGTGGDRVPISDSGGTTAFSSASATAEITVKETAPPAFKTLGGFSYKLEKPGNQYEFTVNATDNVGVVSVTFINKGRSGNENVVLGTGALFSGTAADGVWKLVLPGTTDIKNNDLIQVVISDAAGNSAAKSATVRGQAFSVAPAGVAGEDINLGLTNPESEPSLVTLTVKDLPEGWTLNGGWLQGAEGGWTITTSDVRPLSVTTPLAFAGAVVLQMEMSWVRPDGTAHTLSIANNVEALAPGNPVIAWSGDDHLSGAEGRPDIFVISDPVGHIVIHAFEAHDKVNLIGFEGLASFDELAANMATDAAGNAVITLAPGSTITIRGVRAEDLSGANFVFDEEPVVNNAGTVSLGDGAMLPLTGLVKNTGEITLNAVGGYTLLEVVKQGVVLQGGGKITLSDSAWNVIQGTGPQITLTNVDNTIAGAGHIGYQLTLVNGVLGNEPGAPEARIVATGTHALVIDTGGNVVVNYGTLSATGSGGLVVNGAVQNFGTISAYGGSVTLHGAVTGFGEVLIGDAGSVTFGGAAEAKVAFDAGASGTLVLEDTFHFDGTIAGFDDNDAIHLGLDGELDFAGGTLTIASGDQSVSLTFIGDYEGGQFRLQDGVLRFGLTNAELNC
ncbi:MAG TPA: VCBS domain-containing protein, partial [Vitreimonas sp.]|nr:VCBS domain-containing protein [Vitreimonas sp.]